MGMTFKRLPAKDPRTVARDIPGVFDSLFPQLVPGIVAYFNGEGEAISTIEPVPDALVRASTLSHSMLFEIAYARAERLLAGISEPDWEDNLSIAVERQKRHFDAAIPQTISDNDKAVAEWAAGNLGAILRGLVEDSLSDLQFSPAIPGYQWIASGRADFAIGRRLIEVKCTGKRFSSSDYRQIIMYWLLSYAASVEGCAEEWETGILLNPRLNWMVELPFGEILAVVAGGRSKVEILEQFTAAIGEYPLRMLEEQR
jgi:hypothetical protein